MDNIRAVSEVVPNSLIVYFRDMLSLTGWEEDPEIGHVAGGTRENALWRTMCGDHLILIEKKDVTSPLLRRRCGPQDEDTYVMWRHYGKRNLVNGRKPNNIEAAALIQEMQHASAVVTYGRRFFVTQQGYLGLGPQKMAVGDEVYVFNGSKVPFVLRGVERAAAAEQPSGGGNTSEFPRFRLVGDCYVHGIMDGEACEESTGVKASSLLLC